LGVVGSVITVSVNVPINGQIALWNPSAFPEGFVVSKIPASIETIAG
jgi:hypothetical protein